MIIYVRMLEAVLSDLLPPAVQPGPGGGQQARHLHVLVLAAQPQAGQAGGRGSGRAGPSVRGLWLDCPPRPVILIPGVRLLQQVTS